MNYAIKNFFIATLALLLFVTPLFSFAQSETVATPEELDVVTTIYVFGRDDCGFCKAELEYLTRYDSDETVDVVYLNVITDPAAAQLLKSVTQKHGLPLVTPTTIIGPVVLQGFGGAEVTGAKITTAIEKAKTSAIRSVEEHLESAPVQDGVTVGSYCDPDGTSCEVDLSGTGGVGYVFDLPFVGVVDLKSFSLFSLSAVLGVIDGFNPCAMWVLVTFLVLLSQVGDRKRMFLFAGIFILAEAIMYNLILNVWFTTWDFVALDRYVTPLVGILALGGGAFFLYRYRRNRHQALVCDISDLDSQAKTEKRLKELSSSPLTLGVTGGVIALAFSVNVIEFACSIGIPQAYTKILEINNLTFLSQQLYILVYTLGYMVDDFIVFALALWGFGKLQSHGHKYTQFSLLIGGVLMLILGALLVFNPTLLVL